MVFTKAHALEAISGQMLYDSRASKAFAIYFTIKLHILYLSHEFVKLLHVHYR